jgi:hypothetical protein
MAARRRQRRGHLDREVKAMRSILTVSTFASLLAAALVLAAGACTDDTTVIPATTPDGAAPTSDVAVLPVPVTEDASEAGPIACGASVCPPADFRGVATLPACCTASGACGISLSGASPYLAVGLGCFAPGAPGLADEACPGYAGDGVTSLELQGCCLPDHTCGVFARLSSSIDLGCVATTGFTADAAAPTTCGYRDASVDHD